MSTELIIVIVVVVLAVGNMAWRWECTRPLSPRGGGVAKALGMSKNPGSLATPAGQQMQMARDDVGRAARPGAGMAPCCRLPLTCGSA